MSLTYRGAWLCEATCATCFRLLLASDVTRVEVLGSQGDGTKTERVWGWGVSGCWQQGESPERETSQPESGLSASTSTPEGRQCMCKGRGAWRTDF